MKRLILVTILTLLLGSCYKMPDEPESLKDEYLNVADFIAFYSSHIIDTTGVKVKGVIDKESYIRFLTFLRLIKDDTSATNVYNSIPMHPVSFNIYDPIYGKDRSILVGLSSCIEIDKDDLYSFFDKHSDAIFAYVYGTAHRHGKYFNLSSFDFSLNDTTEIIFKDSM